MDIPIYDKGRIVSLEGIFNVGATLQIPSDYEYMEESGDQLDISVLEGTHPLYFCRMLAKGLEFHNREKYLNNGISILGAFRPADPGEESYFTILHRPQQKFYSKYDYKESNRKIYVLEIKKIMVQTVTGQKSEVTLPEFKAAKADFILSASTEILDRLNKSYKESLEDFCKTKGLEAQGAVFIGVDSFGVDVRIFSGKEIKTFRFSFGAKATSVSMVEKEVMLLICP